MTRMRSLVILNLFIPDDEIKAGLPIFSHAVNLKDELEQGLIVIMVRIEAVVIVGRLIVLQIHEISHDEEPLHIFLRVKLHHVIPPSSGKLDVKRALLHALLSDTVQDVVFIARDATG